MKSSRPSIDPYGTPHTTSLSCDSYELCSKCYKKLARIYFVDTQPEDFTLYIECTSYYIDLKTNNVSNFRRGFILKLKTLSTYWLPTYTLIRLRY